MSDSLLYTIGIVIFVIALSLSVALHEFAHFITAKAFKARVSEFFIGFGPKIWSFKKGETEYGLKLIPAGGYVKIDGMVPPNPPGAVKPKKNFFKKAIFETKEAEYKNSVDLHEERLFYKAPWWKKTIVMGAGATTNLIIAFICFFSIFAFHGIPESVIPDGPVNVTKVIQCSESFENSTTACTPTPAVKAGLKSGDIIESMNGVTVTSWEQFIDYVNENGKSGISLEVLRNNEKINLTLNPEFVPYKETALVGISTATETVIAKHGAIYTVEQMGSYIAKTGEAIIHLPSKLVDVVEATFGQQERQPDGLISIVGAAQISGEVLSNEAVAHASLMDRFMSLISIIGSFNLAIALFNFIPVPPLDGGQMFGAIYEGIKRGYGKIRKISVKPFDASKLVPIGYVSTVLLIFLGFILVSADIFAPVNLFGS